MTGSDERPVNLNRIRKERIRTEEKARADANAVKFGRSKAQRLLEAARDARARKRLDDHHYDTD